MNAYILKLGDLDWVKVFAIGIGAAALYFFLAYDSGTKQISAFQSLTHKRSEIEQQVRETDQQMKNANEFEKEVDKLDKDFEKIRQYMPEKMSTTLLNKVVHDNASLAGVEIAKIAPIANTDKKEFYEMMSIQVEFIGSFSQLVTFLSYMSRVPMLLTFDNFNISSAGTSDVEGISKLRMSGVLSGYRYLRVGEDGQPVQGSGPGTPGIPAGAKP